MSNPVEAPAPAKGAMDGLQPGRIVIFTDAVGNEHAAVVGRVVNPAGMVNLVTFAREGGDAPTTLELAIHYKPDVGNRYTGWRWPDRSKVAQ